MKNQVKNFGQYIKEAEGFGMASRMGSGDSNSPQVGDQVFVAGFAADGDQPINAYAGYGRIVSAKSELGRYKVEFESCFDSAGVSDNAPEGISFRDEDIVAGGDGTWAVTNYSMQFE